VKSNKLKLWVEGARLRTLPLAIAPVAIGAGAADSVQAFDLILSALALAVALSLQIGVNYANDYSDGIRGTDDYRVGPLRLTGSKSVRPEAVKLAAFAFFGLAAASGLAIVLITGMFWLIAVGIAAIELAVFVFFGLVATIGTTYVQVGFIEFNAVLGGIASGLFASAVLMVNNIRDIETDKLASKKTLAVMLGKKAATGLFLVMIWTPFVILSLFTLLYPATLMGFASLLLVAPASLIVLTAKTSKELILVLKLTSFASLSYALALAAGLFIVFF